MKTLKDVYIIVNSSNHEKVSEILESDNLPFCCIYFNFDDIKAWSVRSREGKQEVSFRELKRLINTIPTREEIRRLKAQACAYKQRCKVYESKKQFKIFGLTILY